VFLRNENTKTIINTTKTNILLMMKQSTPTLSFGFLEKLIKTNINKKGMEITNNGLNLNASKNLKCNNE